MSSNPQPYDKLNVFNPSNFAGRGIDFVDFPVAQGTVTLPNGVIWGDGTYQNSSSGGGGGTVTNPLTSNLDGGGFNITNVDTFSGITAVLSEVEAEIINDSAAVIYRNKGAVAPGNYYNVGEGLVMTDAEASCIVVSRCLDAGFKQTIVIHVSMFNAKAHLNLISNAVESDTPIFTTCSAGDDGGGSGGFKLFCNHPSSTWEYRVYRQQDDSGTGTYPPNSSFFFATGAASPGGAWVTTYAELDTSAHASAAVSGSFLAKTSLTSATLQTDTATATVSLSTTRVNTDELNNNGGTGIIDVVTPLRMNNNDIQSAGVIGANAYYTGGPSILPLGAPGGPLYLDTANNRVGVNVAAPQEDFEIDGNIQLDSSGANKIKFYDGTATTERAEIDAVASGTGGQLVLYTKEDPGAVSAKMTIQADGRITIVNRIEGLPNPVAATDAANKQYVDASIPSLTGYVQNPMTSALDGGGFAINNILDPVAAQDAATKNYVDSIVPAPGGVTNPMTAALDGGNFNLFNINQFTSNNRILAGAYIETFDSFYAGQALSTPLQGFCQMMLPQQFGTNSGVMPTWTNGYLDPQKISSRCSVTETVTASGANKLNSTSLISSTIGAYTLLSAPGGVGTNVLLTVPPQLDNHIFNVQVDGEWNGSTIGGNGNSYIYIRDDANTAGTIFGMSTGQAISGTRYPCCLNFTGALPQGTYAILTGHYDLGATLDYTGSLRVAYIGHFSG